MKTIDFNTAEIQGIGRFVVRDDHLAFDWPGTQLHFALTGTSSLTLVMDGASNCFNVDIDDHRQVIETDHGIGQYSVSWPLDDTSTTMIRITQRTEGVAATHQGRTGTVLFQGLIVDDDATISAVPFPAHTIEFIGDSDTAAYGNEGPRTGLRPADRSVFANHAHQDASASWAAVTANAFGAACHNISYSGMGAVWNSPGHVESLAMDHFYGRMLVNDIDSHIDANEELSLPKVDLIVMYIGGNDWWSITGKETEFSEGYANFLCDIRAHRPNVPILIVCANGTSGSCLETQPRQQQFSDEMITLIGKAVEFADLLNVHQRVVVPSPGIDVDNDRDWGVMEHWSAEAHVKWAASVIEHVADITQWTPTDQ
ncbi:MAG: GDSL-type esterase/lipase family protein [Pseudomonadota bacterium]